jgi:putative Holliday junction resolvase
MAQTHNVLAFDVGDRRIGVALASLEARLAAPLITIDRQQHADVMATLMALVHEHAAEGIVIGLPRGMDGQETAQTKVARLFAADFQTVAQVPVHLQDEAGTSLVAEESLQARRKPYAKGDIDKEAAALILQDWLNVQPVEVNS